MAIVKRSKKGRSFSFFIFSISILWPAFSVSNRVCSFFPRSTLHLQPLRFRILWYSFSCAVFNFLLAVSNCNLMILSSRSNSVTSAVKTLLDWPNPVVCTNCRWFVNTLNSICCHLIASLQSFNCWVNLMQPLHGLVVTCTCIIRLLRVSGCCTVTTNFINLLVPPKNGWNNKHYMFNYKRKKVSLFLNSQF